MAQHQYLLLSLQAPFRDPPDRGALDDSDWLSSLVLLFYKVIKENIPKAWANHEAFHQWYGEANF